MMVPQTPATRSAAASRRRTSCGLSALLLLVIVLGTVFPLAGRAQSMANLNGKIIRDVQFKGLHSLTADTLLFYLNLKKGQPLDVLKLNKAIHELWKRQLVDDINVDSQPVGSDGVDLTISVKERPVLRSIEYKGLKRVSNTDLQDRISKEQISVREGDPISLGELERLRHLIEQMYKEKGYRFAEAKYTLEPVSPGERKVVFTIDEGDKVRIERINFTGNTVFSDWRLRWAMKKTKETGLLWRVMRKDIFKQANFDEDLTNVDDLYRSDGYKNASTGKPDIEVRALHPKAKSIKDRKRRMFITVPIHEGHRWKLGKISIEGNKKFKDAILLRQFKRSRGGWLRSKVIDDGVKAIEKIYQNTGYLYAQVQPEVVEADKYVANVIIHVDEGDQYKVGRIEFKGNTRTKDKVLRRSSSVQEGYVLNLGALKNSLRRIGQLDFFKIDESDPVDFDFNNQKKTVDLTIKGREGDRTELLVGGGWSQVDGFFGQFSVKTRNFMGRGETLAADLQTGKYRKYYDFSYFSPWFMDRPQSIGIQIFRHDLDYSVLLGSQYVQKTRGATFTYGRNLGLFSSLSFDFSRYNATDDLQVNGPGGIPITQNYHRKVASIRPTFVYDSRDSRLEPTVGKRFSLSVEYAGGVLSGDTYYVRPEVGFSLFHPVTRYPVKTLFAVNFQAGLIKPFGGHGLFPLDRYYLGGENTLRGFGYRTISVRDKNGNFITDATGFPLGGDKYFQSNLEYHFLLGGPFRVLVFFDAGNVYGTGQNFDLRDLRYSAGVELRVFVPMLGAPLRFIYAKDLHRLPGDRFESFIFSVGTSF
ncbi:MAG TPA: outer membrane protein assembly factor BamA [Desulfuromonadales bacterium]|nr:outer membrane protein assembly factor BamA [Desulfuromonadales bacterium]